MDQSIPGGCDCCEWRIASWSDAVREASRPIPHRLHSIECEDLVFPMDSPF